MDTRAQQAAKTGTMKWQEYSIGAQYKDVLTEPAFGRLAWAALANPCPLSRKQSNLNKDVKDKWGFNVLHFDW